MKVQIWRSFSANNSSSYYLVARFATREQADRCASELADYLAARDAELAAMTPAERGANRDLTLAALELADRVGLTEWPAHIAEGYAYDDELEVATLGSELVVYHNYCTGFDPALAAYLEHRGATVGPDGWNRQPTVSIVIYPRAAPNDGDDRNLIAELDAHFGDAALAAFDGPTAAGFASAVDVDGFEAVRALLDRYPDADLELAVDRPDVAEHFRRIASPCPECSHQPLEYLPASRTAVPDDQLACPGCGGMFTLASLGD